MPLADMRRKHPEESEADGAVAASLVASRDKPPQDHPAKRTRAAVTAAALADAVAAAAETAVAAAGRAAQQQQEGQDAWPAGRAGMLLRRQAAEQKGTESGVGSTQQVDRCGSSDPRAAGGVDSTAAPRGQAALAAGKPSGAAAQAAAAAAAAAPTSEGAAADAEVPAGQPAAREQRTQQPAAKRRKLERPGRPPALPRSALQVRCCWAVC